MRGLEELDRATRATVYSRWASTGRAPAAPELAAVLGLPVEKIRDSLARLAKEHVLELTREGGIRMALPFSAVPTPFPVTTASRRFFANCALSSIGIGVMLREPARIETSCACCDAPMRLEVREGTLVGDEGVAHFLVPAIRWFDDIVRTCQTILLFTDDEHVARWLKLWKVERGAVVPMTQLAALASAWYAEDRRDPEFETFSVEKMERILESCGLRGPFWSLRAG